ncbi:MAG: carboxymuconolactone decarboxylase family protein [Pseudomonadales bacterium]|nr:carboxymuconolactone decarboxylase family protein [Pseudomonadales bacterium]
MRMKIPRVKPVEKSDWNEEQLAAMGKASMDGKILNIFKTLVHHPSLAKRWMVFANHIMGKSSLSKRDREIVILRMGWQCKSGYEWGQHVVIAKHSDLNDDEIEHIKIGPDENFWTAKESLLLLATDQLHSDAFVSDDTWQKLEKHYSTQQLMDIVFTAGQYNLVSMVLNTFGVQLDEGMELDDDLCV